MVVKRKNKGFFLPKKDPLLENVDGGVKKEEFNVLYPKKNIHIEKSCGL